jgi:hypothetical protein
MTLTSRRIRRSVDVVAIAKSKSATLEERVEAFRVLVRDAIRKADERGLELKPYEGTVSLQWPAHVYTDSKDRVYTLRLSCSVLGGPTSHYSWRGRSWRSVFAHAAEDVARWIEEMDREWDSGSEGGSDAQE